MIRDHTSAISKGALVKAAPCSTEFSFVVLRHFGKISRKKRASDRYRKIELALEVGQGPFSRIVDVEELVEPGDLEYFIDLRRDIREFELALHLLHLLIECD